MVLSLLTNITDNIIEHGTERARDEAASRDALSGATRLSRLPFCLSVSLVFFSPGWYLFGEHGNHTRWGVWAPELINNDPAWQEGRGPNSIQILSWLAQAFVLTGEQQYLTGLETLMMEPVRYDANLLNQKMSTWDANCRRAVGAGEAGETAA